MSKKKLEINLSKNEKRYFEFISILYPEYSLYRCRISMWEFIYFYLDWDIYSLIAEKNNLELLSWIFNYLRQYHSKFYDMKNNDFLNKYNLIWNQTCSDIN